MKRALYALLVLLALQHTAVVRAQEEGAGEEGLPASSRYIELKPAFIVNYGGEGRLRYLKTDIALRVAADDKGAGAIRHHMPYIRHTLVMLLSRASEEQLSSMEGREMLRQDALQAVREVLKQEEGEEYVVDLLFNSFIVQR